MEPTGWLSVWELSLAYEHGTSQKCRELKNLGTAFTKDGRELEDKYPQLPHSSCRITLRHDLLAFPYFLHGTEPPPLAHSNCLSDYKPFIGFLPFPVSVNLCAMEFLGITSQIIYNSVLVLGSSSGESQPKSIGIAIHTYNRYEPWDSESLINCTRVIDLVVVEEGFKYNLSVPASQVWGWFTVCYIIL